MYFRTLIGKLLHSSSVIRCFIKLVIGLVVPVCDRVRYTQPDLPCDLLGEHALLFHSFTPPPVFTGADRRRLENQHKNVT